MRGDSGLIEAGCGTEPRHGSEFHTASYDK